jgi:integrase
MSAPATMVTLVGDYLAHRRNLGFQLRSEGSQLLSFARFADSVGHQGALTHELAVRWATLSSQRPRQFPARRLEVLRPFARFRAVFDPATEVPPRGLLGPARRRPLYHLFTESDIAALVEQARQLPPPGGVRSATFAVLFGLLAACGLRVSEALRLTRADVDLDNGVLTIRATKFRKSRLVPLHATTTRALRAYAERRDHRTPRPATATFFTTARGTALPYWTVRNVFVRLRTLLGWETHMPRPRIHDLRHAFVRRCLQRWYAEGVEVAPRIATLATYLGHAKVSDTYWYLTGTPELLAHAATRFEAFVAEPKGVSSYRRYAAMAAATCGGSG